MKNCNEIVYAEMVLALKKDRKVIVQHLVENPDKADLWHMGTGVAGEAGELLDAIKKCAVYGQIADRSNIIEELGDLEFFMEGVRQIVGVTREECLNANKVKLSKRYKDFKYSDEQAKARNDKVRSRRIV